MIKLYGNVARAGAFSGKVVRLGNHWLSERKQLPGNAVFVTQKRLTVGEVSLLPGLCAIISGGGGNTSEEYNYVASGGRWNKIIAFANAVTGDLDKLHDFMHVTVSMEDDGSISVFDINDEKSIHSDIHRYLKAAEPRNTIIRSLDDINKQLTGNHQASKIKELSKKLMKISNSASVEERYRAGELLAKAIHLNRDCLNILIEMSESSERLVRFTAARCMSKLVERHPELLPLNGVLSILKDDIKDPMIPRLIIRALGKGKHHEGIKDIIQVLSEDYRYENIVESVQQFIPDSPRNYY
jgi:hypothetical protein